MLFLTINNSDPSQLEDFFLSPRKAPKEDPEKKKTKGIIEKIQAFLPSKAQFMYLPNVLSFKERYIILALLLIALSSFIALPVSTYYHFTHPVAASGGALREGIIGYPSHINPLLAQNDADRDLSSLVYSGLMRYNEQGTLVNDLAESYSVSDDGLTYVFTLKSNLKWHDNQPLNADDIVFTILTAQNSSYGSNQRMNWQSVDINKKDDTTVIFTLKNKYAQFLNNMTIGILPKHVWENVTPSNFANVEANTKAIGSGPYKFSKLKRDTNGNITDYELTAFKDSAQGKPYITNFNFSFYPSEDDLINAYNNNEVQSLSSISPQKIASLKLQGRLSLQEFQLPRYFGVFLNQSKNKILADRNVRLGLSYATDKNKILDAILKNHGQIVDSPMLPGILPIADVKTKYSFDTEKAKNALENGGWVLNTTNVREKTSGSSKDASSQKLTIELTTSNWSELVAVANQVKDQWASVGIQVNLRILSLPELQKAIKNRDYEALLFGEVLNLDADPFSFWDSSQRKDPGLNLSLYANGDADQLLQQGKQTLLSSARADIYANFQELIAHDIPAIFLYSPNYIYPQPKTVKGNATKIISIPSDRFANVAKWYLYTSRGWGKQ